MSEPMQILGFLGLVLALIALGWLVIDGDRLRNEVAALYDELDALEARMPKPVADTADTADLPALAIHGPWAPTTEEIPVIGKHRAPR